MERIALMVLRLLHRVPAWFYKLITWAKNDKHSLEEKYALLQEICIQANRAGRVKVQVTGLEHIPETSGFLFTPNHQGFFDMLTLIATCPQPLSAVLKQEAKNWPLVKQVRLLLNCITLDRTSPKDALRVITEMSERIKAGENFVIFPEGTRSRNGNAMNEFKAGTFKSAFMAKCTIVPVALIDCFQPFDRKGIQPVTVQIHYLKPIPYEEYQGMRTKELAQLVQQRIQDAMDTHVSPQ